MPHMLDAHSISDEFERCSVILVGICKCQNVIYCACVWHGAQSAAENARNYKGENRFSTYYVTAHVIESADRSGGNQFHSVKKNQNG